MNPSEHTKSAPFLLNEMYGNLEQITRIFYWIIALILLALIAGTLTVLSTNDILAARIIAINIVPVIASLFLIRRMKFELVATLLAVLFITSITLTATFGEGIHHLSILGYPAVLIVASLVIRKRMMVLLTSYNILCVAWLVFGELLGFYQPQGIAGSVPGDFFTVSIILIVTAIMVRLITETMFQNAVRLRNELRERKRIEADLQRRADEMTLLYQLGISLASGQDLQSTLLALQSEIEQLIKADSFFVAIHDRDTDLIRFPVFFDEGKPIRIPDRPLHEQPGLTGAVILNHQSLYLPDMMASDVDDKYHPFDTDGPILHTFLGIPLVVNGQAIGAISTQTREIDAYNSDQIHLMETLAVQAALAIDKARVLEDLQRELTERKRAQDALAFSELRFYQAFHNSPVMMTLEANHLFTDVNQAFVDATGYNREEILGHPASALQLFGSEKDRQLLSDLNTAQEGIRDVELHFRRKSGEVGMVLLSSDKFDVNGTLYELTSALDITGRKKAEQQIRLQLERLTTLKSIDQIIASSFDLKISLEMLLTEVINQLKVDASDVLVLSPFMNRLEFCAGRGFRDQSREKVSVALGEGYAGRAALERQTMHIANLKAGTDDSAFNGWAGAENFTSYYCIPLIAKGHVKGVLEVFHRSTLDPEAEWLDFLETLGQRAAIAVDNIGLFNDLQRSNNELMLAYDATIEGWSRAMDLRDEETEGHTKRVTEMTLKLAADFGVPDGMLIQIRRGALLHDIGKLGVPDSILLKPGKLTEQERAIMKKHPALAFEMLSSVQYLNRAINIPYCHHEKWDGTGYPRGLKGEQIPLEARIFAVVDVWDALTSDRPYRRAWSNEQALEHIRALAGIHFDPAVVERFMGLKK